MLELLYVYKIASFGGVERVLLNRAEAFRRHKVGCRLSLFFYEDEGALGQIRGFVEERGLGAHVRLVDRVDAAQYDHVVAIDTPEVLTCGVPLEKVAFECHTTYHASRRYLADLPEEIGLVAVPSEAARAEVAERFPRLRQKLVVVRNCIPGGSGGMPPAAMAWQKRPLLYLGRVDEHKNFTEVLDIFRSYRETFGDDLFLLVVGPVVKEIDLQAEIASRGMGGRVVVLPPVGFARVWQVYSLVKSHRGVFVSASKGESFGLSAAEALTAGLPVVLSGIPAHASLVDGRLEYLYPLGDAAEGARKLRGVFEAYDRAAAAAEVLGRQFSVEIFLADWLRFVARLTGDGAAGKAGSAG